MRFSNMKIAQPILFVGALGITSLIWLINVEPSRASVANYYKPSTPCKTSVPEPYPFVGILALGILGGGYLLRQRLSKKVADLNNQQPRKLPFIQSDKRSEENYHPLSYSLELQLIDPTEIIYNNYQ
ncbi:hypothetical protein N0Y54_43880 [Nostoc punctiforme UO1]|uniref:hypothetical protein n=1 Tax=Nostoc punctiforme TaxID=272131 RepID=UPI0030951210